MITCLDFFGAQKMYVAQRSTLPVCFPLKLFTATTTIPNPEKENKGEQWNYSKEPLTSPEILEMYKSSDAKEHLHIGVGIWMVLQYTMKERAGPLELITVWRKQLMILALRSHEQGNGSLIEARCEVRETEDLERQQRETTTPQKYTLPQPLCLAI